MTKVKHLPDIVNNIFSAEYKLKISLLELDYLNNVLAPKRPTDVMMQRGAEVINQLKTETVPSKILAKEIYIHMISNLFEDSVLGDKEDVFIFLDNLRKSGDINMYAAATDIMNEFGFSKPEAKKALKSWISEYKE